MGFKNRAFTFAQTGYILIVLLALFIFPGADIYLTLLAMVGVWVITSIIYRHTPWHNRAGWWTLLIASTILAVGIVANVHYFTIHSGGSTQLPILQNPDSFRFHYDALFSAGHSAGIPTDTKNHGYGMFISWLWNITGITIVAPMVLNMLFVLIGVILSGGITWKILQGRTQKSSNWCATCAMIMTSSVCYYLNSGTLLLKEAGLIFAFPLVTYCIISIQELPISRLQLAKLLGLFILGIILITILRFYFLIMVIIGILMMAKWQQKNIVFNSVLIAICICSWLGESSFIYTDYSRMPEDTSLIIAGRELDDAFFFDNSDHLTYNSIVKGYLGYPWWLKTILLPMTAAVQYLIPLPWGFCDDIHFGYTLAYAHISYPWYIIGGLILYFIIFKFRNSPKALQRLILWGVLMWLVPAYLFAGTVSRYALPMLPLIIPAAVYIASKWHECKKMKLWIWCYCSILVIGLIAGYIVQKGVLL